MGGNLWGSQRVVDAVIVGQWWDSGDSVDEWNPVKKPRVVDVGYQRESGDIVGEDSNAMAECTY